MKLPKTLLVKDTLKLFHNKYQYKIVFRSSGAILFRNKNYNYAHNILNKNSKPFYLKIKEEDKNQIEKMINLLETFDQNEFTLRIESPLISLYTNNEKYIENIISADSKNVKYVCVPNKNLPALEKNNVIVKKLNFQYKVYIGTTNQNYNSFVAWAEQNSKIKITKKCKKDLSNSKSFGGSYFYVADEKNMTVVKLFLGSNISKIETVTKA